MRSWKTWVAMNWPRRLEEFMDFSLELELEEDTVVWLSSHRWLLLVDGSSFETDDVDGFPSLANEPPPPPTEGVELVTVEIGWIDVGSFIAN